MTIEQLAERLEAYYPEMYATGYAAAENARPSSISEANRARYHKGEATHYAKLAAEAEILGTFRTALSFWKKAAYHAGAWSAIAE